MRLKEKKNVDNDDDDKATQKKSLDTNRQKSGKIQLIEHKHTHNTMNKTRITRESRRKLKLLLLLITKQNQRIIIKESLPK